MNDRSDRITVALWAVNLAVPVNGIDGWAAAVESRMAEALEAGAELLILPEYVSEQWLSFAPPDLPLDQEVPWMADRVEQALQRLAPLTRKFGLALLAGTMPVTCEGAANGGPRHLNRAHLLLPDGRMIAQDKLCLTPAEKDPAGWWLATGNQVRIVEWEGLRLATLICLDTELPALVQRLAGEDLDLLLVPSMTAKLSGYSRVFGCAKARAIELLTAVCAVGCIGSPATGRPHPGNTSGAAVFLPCEEVLGHRGVAAEIPPAAVVAGPGPLLIARDLPLKEIRALRRGGAEVWPGAWKADHVTVLRDHGEGTAR